MRFVSHEEIGDMPHIVIAQRRWWAPWSWREEQWFKVREQHGTTWRRKRDGENSSFELWAKLNALWVAAEAEREHYEKLLDEDSRPKLATVADIETRRRTR